MLIIQLLFRAVKYLQVITMYIFAEIDIEPQINNENL